jgi:hypothetical protein
MAVENKYTDAELAAGKLGNPANISGAESQAQVLTFEVAAADDDGSIYRIAKSLNPNLIITKVEINNDAITAGTDYDLGLYETITDGSTGPVIAVDVFAAALDMSAAAANGSEKNGLANVAIEDLGNKIYEHAGHTVNTKKQGYDLALTANIVGSAAGTISVRITYVQG